MEKNMEPRWDGRHEKEGVGKNIERGWNGRHEKEGMEKMGGMRKRGVGMGEHRKEDKKEVGGIVKLWEKK